jgi:ubiquinone/menaquinone biosynthesis C-methylase UbiE
LFLGYFVSKALLVAAQLDIAERLAGGAATTKELAQAAGADERSLYRLLRTLASVGVFQEDEGGRFSNTDLSDALRADVPGNLKSWAFTFCDGPAYSAWDEAGYSVRTSRCAFEKVHGSHPFEHMAKNPEFGRLFGEAMTSLTWNENAGIHANIDFSAANTLVDVGGGNGQFLMSCLAKNPNQRGILLDRPDVLGRARELVDASGYANRCEIVGGDFFKEVPAGDAYVMKYILHDWGDEEALTILKNIHRASRKGTKLYVMDMVVEPGNAPSFAKMVDLWALVFYGGGRERTRAEFESLFRAAGFRLIRAVPTSSFINTIEAERE